MIHPFEDARAELERRAQDIIQLRAKAAGDHVFRRIIEQNLDDQLTAIDQVCQADGADELRKAQINLISVRSFPAYLMELMDRGAEADRQLQEPSHED